MPNRSHVQHELFELIDDVGLAKRVDAALPLLLDVRLLPEDAPPGERVLVE